MGDYAKFDNPALYKIADIDRLDAIVTDRKPTVRWMEAAQRKRIKMIYPKDSKTMLDL